MTQAKMPWPCRWLPMQHQPAYILHFVLPASDDAICWQSAPLTCHCSLHFKILQGGVGTMASMAASGEQPKVLSPSALYPCLLLSCEWGACLHSSPACISLHTHHALQGMIAATPWAVSCQQLLAPAEHLCLQNNETQKKMKAKM